MKDFESQNKLLCYQSFTLEIGKCSIYLLLFMVHQALDMSPYPDVVKMFCSVLSVSDSLLNVLSFVHLGDVFSNQCFL